MLCGSSSGKPEESRLNLLEINIVLHGPTPLHLSLLSVITHNPTLKSQVFYYYQQFTVLEDHVQTCHPEKHCNIDN